jgi:ATP-dependent Clp protease ATP-binding subunit ClpA
LDSLIDTSKGETSASVLKEAKSLLEQAEYQFKVQNENKPNHVKREISKIFNGLVLLFGSIIKLFDITTLIEPDEVQRNSMYSGAVKYPIQDKFTQFAELSAMLLLYVGAAFAGKIITAIAIGFGVLGFLWKYIEPMPVSLQNGTDNWTQEIRDGTVIYNGRKESLDQMASILKRNRHPMLVGPSRTGKNATAKSFASAVERGDYPELKGKAFFYINTATISQLKDGYSINGADTLLRDMVKKMGRHSKEIVIVFDEIHNACKEPSNLAEILKPFLDEGGKLPHIIGITTEKEYEEHVKKNTAFDLRFDKVEIKSTEKDETLKIMGDYCIQKNKHLLFSPDALETIYAITSQDKNAPQPLSSINLLEKCIAKTERTQKSPLQLEKSDLETKVKSYASRTCISGSKPDLNDPTLKALKEKLSAINKKCDVEQNEVNLLFKATSLLHRTKMDIYKTSIKLAKIARTFFKFSEKNQLKRYILLDRFMQPEFKDFAIKKSQNLEFKIIIDSSLIHEVAKEIAAANTKPLPAPVTPPAPTIAATVVADTKPVTVIEPEPKPETVIVPEPKHEKVEMPVEPKFQRELTQEELNLIL